MKITPYENAVKVKRVVIDTVIERGVTLDLNEKEAAYLYHMLGCLKTQAMVHAIRESISYYYPSKKDLLIDLDNSKVNAVLVNPIHNALENFLNLTKER